MEASTFIDYYEVLELSPNANSETIDRMLAQHPPDNKQRFNQRRQIRHLLDEFLDAGLEPRPPSYADLEAEVA